MPAVPRLVALDGLRGVCALVVVLSHVLRLGAISHEGAADLSAYAPLIAFAHVAVLTFFVLSGFVIGLTTQREFTAANVREYAGRRLIRIYPIYLVGLALAYAVDPSQFTWASLVHHLGFAQVYSQDTVVSNGSLWTLHYEVVFYALFLLVWYLGLRPGRLALSLAAASLLLLVSGAYLLTVAAYFSLWCSGLWLAREAPDGRPSRCGPATMWLTACAAYWAAPLGPLLIGAAPTVPAIAALGLSQHPLQDVAVALLIVAPVAQLAGKRVPFASIATALVWLATAAPVAAAIRHGVAPPLYWAAAACLAIAALAVLVPLELRRTLSRLKPLGDISYGLYATHLPIVLIGLALVEPGMARWKLYAVEAGCAAAALAAAYVVEARFHRAVAGELKPLLLPGRRAAALGERTAA
jgi:peptidoglycan/LPS O-acetylase OafA/YrhL